MTSVKHVELLILHTIKVKGTDWQIHDTILFLIGVLLFCSTSSPTTGSEFHCAFEEDEDDEDKVIPRSQSMDNLLFDMHQPQLE